jgi:hydrogenase maturation protein HypF
MAKGVPLPEISRKFHETLIKMFSELCRVIRKERGLNRVVLSGGVFQNSLLLSGLVEALEKTGFQVFTHTQVPTNDGGIALGQAIVAAAIA